MRARIGRRKCREKPSLPSQRPKGVGASPHPHRNCGVGSKTRFALIGDGRPLADYPTGFVTAAGPTLIKLGPPWCPRMLPSLPHLRWCPPSSPAGLPSRLRLVLVLLGTEPGSVCVKREREREGERGRGGGG